MDLFDHKLTTNEALHLDSLLDTGGYDPYLLLVGSMMKDENYLPTKHQSEQIMKHIGDSEKFQQTSNVERTQNEPKIANVEPQNEPKIANVEPETENKNPTLQYIKLPDASIQRRKYKQKQSKAQGNNESQPKQ